MPPKTFRDFNSKYHYFTGKVRGCEDTYSQPTRPKAGPVDRHKDFDEKPRSSGQITSDQITGFIALLQVKLSSWFLIIY